MGLSRCLHQWLHFRVILFLTNGVFLYKGNWTLQKDKFYSVFRASPVSQNNYLKIILKPKDLRVANFAGFIFNRLSSTQDPVSFSFPFTTSLIPPPVIYFFAFKIFLIFKFIIEEYLLIVRLLMKVKIPLTHLSAKLPLRS